jgi:hypothetical protein
MELERGHSLPGGRWSDRQREFKRTLFALFRKQFSIKFRSLAALFELFVALTFCFIFYPIDTITISHYRETRAPPVSHSELVSMAILKFFLWSNESRFAVTPSNGQTAALAERFAEFRLSMTSIVHRFASSADDFRARRALSTTVWASGG